jgi:hypothetical protein
MVEGFMELRRIQAEIGEILDRLDRCVIVGTKTPVEVDSVVVKLEVPGSCDECFFCKVCISGFRGEGYCEKTWKKIIDHHKNK